MFFSLQKRDLIMPSELIFDASETSWSHSRPFLRIRIITFMTHRLEKLCANFQDWPIWAVVSRVVPEKQQTGCTRHNSSLWCKRSWFRHCCVGFQWGVMMQSFQLVRTGFLTLIVTHANDCVSEEQAHTEPLLKIIVSQQSTGGHRYLYCSVSSGMACESLKFYSVIFMFLLVALHTIS